VVAIPEGYFKTKDELLQLKTKLPDLWNEVQDCIKTKKIDREFISIIGRKK